MATILFRRGTGPPSALAEGEPGLDLTAAAPKLYAGVGGAPVLLADPALVASLAVRVAALETALREVQFKSWLNAPLTPGTIIPP
jgi:hypothetical protein